MSVVDDQPRTRFDYVTAVGPNDVLLGRGAPFINNEGNVRFRDLVTECKLRYLACRRRQQKTEIAQEIIDTISRRGGKFLRSVAAEDAVAKDIPGSVEAWVLVDDRTIMQKVKQTLREKETKYRHSGTSARLGDVSQTSDISRHLRMSNPSNAPTAQISTSALPLAYSEQESLALAVGRASHDYLNSFMHTSNPILDMLRQQELTSVFPVRTNIERAMDPFSSAGMDFQNLQTRSLLQQQILQNSEQIANYNLLRLQLGASSLQRNDLLVGPSRPPVQRLSLDDRQLFMDSLRSQLANQRLTNIRPPDLMNQLALMELGSLSHRATTVPTQTLPIPPRARESFPPSFAHAPIALHSLQETNNTSSPKGISFSSTSRNVSGSQSTGERGNLKEAPFSSTEKTVLKLDSTSKRRNVTDSGTADSRQPKRKKGTK